ncbi:hypothetical protein [Desulfitibacter alkalitolerans]|uniref:hypothetical protein n=1 Tax=Desulfitibacter alkalitolerans TaxID=264641 RepID=UPI000487828F|nr:hypothetical protein [Desulfitibacter alkalitolerans]
MNINIKARATILVLCILVILVIYNLGCQANNKVKPLNIMELDKITAEIVSITRDGEMDIYTYQLENGTTYSIKQNIIYFSYPIKIDNGYVENQFKIEAQYNKLDIKPGEKWEVKVYVPIVIFDKIYDAVLDEPHLEIKGFFNKVENHTQFHKNF